jgi:hypothetical protein
MYCILDFVLQDLPAALQLASIVINFPRGKVICDLRSQSIDRGDTISICCPSDPAATAVKTQAHKDYTVYK